MYAILLRIISEVRLQPLLQRLNNQVAKNAQTALCSVLGVAGFLVARNAIERLWFLD